MNSIIRLIDAMKDLLGLINERINPPKEQICPTCGRKQVRSRLCSDCTLRRYEAKRKDDVTRLKRWYKIMKKNHNKLFFNERNQCAICRSFVPGEINNKNIVKHCSFCEGDTYP